MTLAQLIAFREVMLTGSISQAARNLGRTQPALSSTLASLERDLGFALFERRRKHLLCPKRIIFSPRPKR